MCRGDEAIDYTKKKTTSNQAPEVRKINPNQMDSIMRIADIRIEIMGWLEEKDRWALFIAFLYENPLICNYRNNNRNNIWLSLEKMCHQCWVIKRAWFGSPCRLCGKRLCDICVKMGVVLEDLSFFRLCKKCAAVVYPLTRSKERQPAIKRLKFEK